MADIINVLQDGSEIEKIHTLMKEPSRHIYGKVYITYTDPMLAGGVEDVLVDTEAYNSNKWQVVDDIREVNRLYFTLYDNDLSGNYHPISEADQVGWSSAALSNADGTFTVAPTIEIQFPARPLFMFTIHLDDSRGSVAEDFVVTITDSNGDTREIAVTGNTESEVTLFKDDMFVDAVSIKLTFTKVTKGGFPVTVLDMPALSTILYVGYQDESNLISMRLLEELTYKDEIEALGGVSANEIDIVLDNANKDFNFNNASSPVARQLQRNRKIEPWLGTIVDGNEITWYKLGTFWSYTWDVPFNSLTASVTGFDTIGLLDISSFTNHQVLVDKSLGELIEYVLTDAKSTLQFLEWFVDPELYNVIIPYAWFSAGSHAAALRKISESYPMHIYCDRQGRICAAPQRLRQTNPVDIWSDDTNVVDKTYSSLYTVLPNVINVSVVIPKEVNEELVKEEVAFTVDGTLARTLSFNKPYLSDLVVNVTKDSSVSYTYTAYSWGIEFTFTGSGTVRSIVCNGTALDTDTKRVVTAKDDISARINGTITRDVASDFIQTNELATYISTRLLDLSTYDKYDVDVTYRGDIALTINDTVLLKDGLAPDLLYNIKRHELNWDGGLTGTATLNS